MQEVQLSTNSRVIDEKKFFESRTRSTSGLQPRSVYKDSSSVNKCHFLWISQLTREKSSVYTRYKRRFAAVCSWWQIWTKIAAVEKAGFLHKPFLWISRSLSTLAPLAYFSSSGKLRALNENAGADQVSPWLRASVRRSAGWSMSTKKCTVGRAGEASMMSATWRWPCPAA